MWLTMELLQCQKHYGFIPSVAAVPLMFHGLRSLDFRGLRMRPIYIVPQHWRDDKHELDGTAFSHIAIEPTIATTNPLTPEQIIRGPLQFTTGANVGATTLLEQMEEIETKITRRLSSLTTDQWGKVTCHDDVSGDILDSELVQAARDLEVEYLKKTRMYLPIF